MKLPPIPRSVLGALCKVPVKIRHLPDAAGMFLSGNRKPQIRINKVLPHDYRWQTFFHELIHLMELDGGFELKDEDHDSHVDRLATQMFATWLRNGWTLPGQ